MIEYEFKKVEFAKIYDLNELGKEGWNVCHVNYSEILLSRQKNFNTSLLVLMVIHISNGSSKTVNFVFQDKLEYRIFVKFTLESIENLKDNLLTEELKQSKYYDFYKEYLSDLVLNQIDKIEFYTYSSSEKLYL